MKIKNIFAFLLLLVAGLQSVKAQEEYAVYTSANKTLTFYYDNLRASRPGTSYSVKNQELPEWRSIASNVEKVVFDPSFAGARPTHTRAWFSEMENLTSITDIKYLNTSNVYVMSFMFNDCSSLTSIDLSHFNTAKVNYFDSMFQGCESLTSLDLSHFNTVMAEDMNFMFNACTSLKSIDMSHFNTANVRNMQNMFQNCISLTSLNLSSFNTAQVTNMWDMFALCGSLTSLDLSSFNTSNVQNMCRMFWGCTGLKNLNIRYFDTRNVTDMSYMFSSCSSLTSLDLSNFNTSKVSNMEHMFEYCSKLTSLDVSGFNTSNVTNMNSMFDYCRSLPSLDVSNFNTEKVYQMGRMFRDCESLKTLNLSNFYTPKVRYESHIWSGFKSMFSGCKSLTSLNISHFNTENADILDEMFKDCRALTVLDLSSFDTRDVRYIDHMFENCEKLKRIYVGTNWSTAGLEPSVSTVFEGCLSLVGGAGTTYDPDHIDASYAHVDGGTSYPGYLTLKAPAEHYDFRYGGIYYLDIIGGNWEAAVTYEDTDYGTYSGDVIIPEEVMNSINEVYYTVTCIGERAFYRCPYLTSVTLPATINRIENEAFVDAFLDPSHSTITCLAKTPPTISPLAFDSGISLLTLYVRKGCKAAYEAHDVWKQFGNIVELPYHFQVRNAYYQITGENTVSVVNRDANYYSYWSQVTIPATVTYEGVTYTVNKIANVAFFKCPELIRVIMPSTITSIGNRSFKDCTRLTSITLPENLQSIGIYAFDGCTALTDITCLATTPPSIDYTTFTESQYQDGNLYVPYGCYNLYWNAPNWEYFRNIFELPPIDDAINEVAETVKETPWYDLSGRKVTNPRKGIYIKNGKKVSIK